MANMYVILAVLCAVIVVSTGTGCGSGWVGLNTAKGTTCYQFFPNDVATWDLAQSRCVAHGGNLASVRSSAELIFISGMRVVQHPNVGNIWLGGKRLGNKWFWERGSNWDVMGSETFWSPGNPNNYKGSQNCLAIWQETKYAVQWDDQFCTDRNSFICEKRI